VYGEEEIILYWADYRNQGLEKNLFCTGAMSPTNQPTKEEPVSAVLLESPFASVSTVNQGHPSLGSLVVPRRLMARGLKRIDILSS